MHYSMFDVHKFPLRSDRTLAASGGARIYFPPLDTRRPGT